VGRGVKSGKGEWSGRGFRLRGFGLSSGNFLYDDFSGNASDKYVGSIEFFGDDGVQGSGYIFVNALLSTI